VTATSTTKSVKVSGLPIGNAQTFTYKATNDVGTSGASLGALCTAYQSIPDSWATVSASARSIFAGTTTLTASWTQELPAAIYRAVIFSAWSEMSDGSTKALTLNGSPPKQGSVTYSGTHSLAVNVVASNQNLLQAKRGTRVITR
jgi:hypothetical protein